MKKNSKLPLLLLAGVGVGAAVLYLFRTEEGKKTYDSLANSAKELGDTIKDKAIETIENVKDKVKNA